MAHRVRFAQTIRSNLLETRGRAARQHTVSSYRCRRSALYIIIVYFGLASPCADLD